MPAQEVHHQQAPVSLSPLFKGRFMNIIHWKLKPKLRIHIKICSKVLQIGYNSNQDGFISKVDTAWRRSCADLNYGVWPSLQLRSTFHTCHPHYNSNEKKASHFKFWKCLDLILVCWLKSKPASFIANCLWRILSLTSFMFESIGWGRFWALTDLYLSSQRERR